MILKDWNDVTLGIWMRMNEITQRENEIERLVGYVALANELTEEEVLALPLDKFKEYMKGLAWMNTPPEIEQPKKEYVINGHTYVLTMNFHQLTTAQYIDFQSYSKSEDYSEMLSVFLIPKGHKYGDDYDVFEVQQDMKQMPVQEVLGLMGFFIVLYRSWSAALWKYSSRMLKKAAKREKSEELMETVKKMEELADMFGFR